jgi:hypothetical protein
VTLRHGWLLLTWIGCTSVSTEPPPAVQGASLTHDSGLATGVLSIQRSTLEEIAENVLSNVGPVTLTGMAGWPVVAYLGNTRVRFDPSSDTGDGRIRGIARVETVTTLIIPPFFQVDDVPLHLSMPLVFDMRPADLTCMELRAFLDGPILLDMSHFAGDMGAVTQGLLESLLTEQVNQILTGPLWAPRVPTELCPALSPVHLLSRSDAFSASFGGPSEPTDSSKPSLPADMNWSIKLGEGSLGRVLDTLGSSHRLSSRWALGEATSRIEGESWVVEARVSPRRHPDRGRKLRGDYLWKLTDSEMNVTQVAFVQTSADSPPLWPSVAAIRAKLNVWTHLMTRPRSVDTEIWGQALRASLEEFVWHPDELTVLGRIEALNSPAP